MYTRVCALIIENDGVLVVRHKLPRGTLWHLPGGKLENQELSFEEAVKRELWEELKVEIKVGRLAFVCKEKLNNSNEVRQLVYFAERISLDLPTINPEKTSGDKAEFMPIGELDRLTLYPNIGKEIISIAHSRPEKPIYLDIASPREWL